MYYCTFGLKKKCCSLGDARGREQFRCLVVAGLTGLGKYQLQPTALNLPGKAALPDEERCSEPIILFRKVYLV